MRHARIQKSKRHKKLKVVNEVSNYNFLKDKSIEKLKDQQMPRKLRDLIASKSGDQNKQENKSQDEPQSRSIRKLRKKANAIVVKTNNSSQMEAGMTRPTKPMPEVVEKRTAESEGHFLNRINFMVAKAMSEAKLEEHFDVDLQEQKQPKQSTSFKKQEMALLDDKQKKRLEAKRDKQKKKDLTKKAKKLLKQRRLVKEIAREDDGLNRKDHIRFGERVDAPPTLVVPKRVAKLSKLSKL